MSEELYRVEISGLKGHNLYPKAEAISMVQGAMNAGSRPKVAKVVRESDGKVVAMWKDGKRTK